MAGIKTMRKIQLGREVTPGTAVAATALWRGVGVLEDNREVTFVEEDVGFFSGTDRSYISKIEGAITFGDTPATFEQILHIFEAGIKSVGTGAADGAGTDKIYTYTLPTSTLNTIKTYTIEGGDNQQAEKMEYAFVKHFKLTAEAGSALMLTADWIGRQVQDATFTGAIAIPTVEDIMSSSTKLYIDEPGGTMGTTLVSGTLRSVEIDVVTGVIPLYAIGTGALYFANNKFVPPEVVLTMTYEHNSGAVTEKAKFRAMTPRQIRIDFEGSNVATPGTTFTKKTLRCDFVGKYESWDGLSDQDGNDIVTCKLRAKYNATAAKFCEFKVAVEVTTVP